MGAAISLVIRCLISMTDRYNDWRYGDDFATPQAIHLDPADVQRRQHKDLFSAIIDQNEVAIRTILSSDEAKKTALNSSKETPVHSACKLGYFSIAKILIEENCPANIQTAVGSPLHSTLKAMKSQYADVLTGVQMLTFLIDVGGCELEHKDNSEKTALFMATEIGQLPCVRLLVSKGALVNATDTNNFTPLYMAAIEGELAILHVLLNSRQVSVDICDNWGRTALMAALITIMNMFKYEHAVPPLIEQYNRMAIAEALIFAGCDPNLVDSQGREALSVAFVIVHVDTMMRKNRAGEVQHHLQQNGIGKASTEEDLPADSPYAPLLRMLVLYGAVPPSGSPAWLQEFTTADTKLMIRDSLQHECRKQIRLYMAANRKLHLIHKLHLPQALGRFLRFETF